MPTAEPGDVATSTRTITRDRIRQYADLTGDHNPLHVDDDYAEERLFGGVIAHGMLTAGVLSAAVAALPGDVVWLSQDLNFDAPVRPGDEVTARVEVVEDLGEGRLRADTVAETEDETVLTGEAEVLVLRDE
jgi:3-hydroxybutyryl-CoA dehydratase